MKSNIATGCLIGSLMLVPAWSVAQQPTKPQAVPPKPAATNPQQQQPSQYQATVNQALKTISIETDVTRQCVQIANRIQSLKPPKDHDLHLNAKHGAAAAKAHGFGATQAHVVAPPNPADVQYERQLQQQVAAFSNCGARFKQGRPGAFAAQDWLFNNVHEKDVATHKQVEAVFGHFQQALHELAEEVVEFSKDKIHQQAVHDVLHKYFFEVERRALPPKQP